MDRSSTQDFVEQSPSASWISSWSRGEDPFVHFQSTARGGVGRATTARPGDVNFVPSSKLRKGFPVASYVKGPGKVKRYFRDRHWSSILTSLGWLVCLFLLVRLVFTERGIWDYYKMQKILEAKQIKLDSIIEENKSLLIEIKRIEQDHGVQKKLVRDHLGFIAEDEFQIIFAKERGKRSI